MAFEEVNILTLAMAKKYTDKSLAGAGAVAGVPCQIQSIKPITGGNRITFIWEDNNNVSHTSTLDVMDGAGGEENKIDSISVNGSPISIDENKNVDITVPSIEGLTKDADLATVAKSGSYNDLIDTPAIPSVEGLAKTTDIPTKVSQLENDSNYLSSIPEEYVTDTELEAKGYLTEHQDLSAYATKDEIPTVPSKVSELTNDSNYQTAEQVNSTVTTEIAKVVADAPEDLNTLKEMSDWIAGHEDDASAMNSAISDNKTAITALQTGKADKSEIPTTVAELTDSDDYAKTTDIPTTLPADGGNADTVNNHTVETDVPENAVFTDTVLEINDEDTSETTVWSSKKTSDTLYKKANTSLITMRDLGFTKGAEVPLEDFILAISKKMPNHFSTTYKVAWGDTKAATVIFSNKKVSINGGTLYCSQNSIVTNNWTDLSVLYVPSNTISSNIYKFIARNSENAMSVYMCEYPCMDDFSNSTTSTWSSSKINSSLNDYEYTQVGAGSPDAANCNDFYEYGNYTTYRAYAPTNCPTGLAWGFFETIPFRDKGYAKQICKALATNRVYIRTLWNGTWGSWTELATMDDTTSSTISTYSSSKIDKKLNGTSITVPHNDNGFSYYSIAYSDSYTESGNQGILIQHNRLNFSTTTYLFNGTKFKSTEFRCFITKISGNTDKVSDSEYDIKFYLDKEADILYLKIPTYSMVSLTDLLVQSNEITATKVDAIPDTATKMTVIEYASTASLVNYSIPLNLYMGYNHYLAIKVKVHDMNYYFNMSDRSGNIYEGSFFSYNSSFSTQIKKINDSSTKNGYILGFRQYKVSNTEIYLVMKVSDYTYINGVINTSSALKSNIEILVNDDSTLWDSGTDITVQNVATTDKLGGLTFSASGTTLSITNGTNTWTLEANS